MMHGCKMQDAQRRPRFVISHMSLSVLSIHHLTVLHTVHIFEPRLAQSYMGNANMDICSDSRRAGEGSLTFLVVRIRHSLCLSSLGQISSTFK